MIKKIYKYKLEAVPRQTIKLPVLAQPLKVGHGIVAHFFIENDR